MSNIIITLLAYLIDHRFGEFRFITHPIIIIGKLISYCEKKLYKNSILKGFLLVTVVVSVVSSVSILLYSLLELLPTLLSIIITSILASMFVAHRMLYDAVYEVTTSPTPKKSISMLVSRDTKNMSESDIYKAAIETYAENLSDGVVAPLFYLLLFNLPGIIIYKAINTMDSMIAYRNERYEKFGKVAAHLDDIANFIPSRITALLIMLLARMQNIFAFYEDGKRHESPNAGHPITAMALVLGLKLGGDTSYFGKIKKKPNFGEGRVTITKNDVLRALHFYKKERL